MYVPDEVEGRDTETGLTLQNADFKNRNGGDNYFSVFPQLYFESYFLIIKPAP